jgi:hypothetical protein
METKYARFSTSHTQNDSVLCFNVIFAQSPEIEGTMEGISVRLHVSLPKPFNPSEWQLEPDVTYGHNCRAVLSSQSNSCDICGYDACEYEDQGFWDVTCTLKVAEHVPTKGWSSRNYTASYSRRPKYTKVISKFNECQFQINFERVSWARASLSKLHDHTQTYHTR